MRKGLIVGLIVLIGLVIAADRIGLLLAQKAIAKTVASQYQLDHEPKVSIKGFPFLTQALGGQYREIDVTVGDVTEQGVRLSDATVELKGVTASVSDALNGDPSEMVADSATSTATVAYRDVDREAPRGMKVSAQDSALRVRGPVTVLGLTRQITTTVTVTPAGRSVRVVPQKVDTGGLGIPVGVVKRAFTFTVPVRGLPLGTRITDVQVLPDGLRVSATAHDVKLSSLNAH
jgi:LmeA-like phospholipid-binding